MTRTVRITEGWVPIPEDFAKEADLHEGDTVELEWIDGAIVMTFTSRAPRKAKK